LAEANQKYISLTTKLSVLIGNFARWWAQQSCDSKLI